MVYSRLLVLLVFVFIHFGAHAGEENKTLSRARKALAKGDYAEAKKQYNLLLQKVTDNPEYFFEAGISYYNSDIEKEKALGYFENALKTSKTDTIAEIFYYLGRSYQYVNEFDKAIVQYNRFKNYIDASSKKSLLLMEDIDKVIEMCNNGIKFLKTQNKKWQVKNLGKNVNTIYSEYAPVVKKDESLLVFTARKNSNVGDKFYNDGKKFEDIYVSVMQDLETLTWSYATKFDSSGTYISKKINSKYHDAAIGYNEAEDKLFIYRLNDVWMSELKDGKWSDPVRLNSKINTKGQEPSVFITPDEQMLYYVSTRTDGLGGRDIWTAKKMPDGQWGEIKNIGPVINSPLNEDAPFLSKDGKTLYFSSQGFNSIGGYDIFKSELDSTGNWGKPINLGMPLNSPGDDIYYIQSADNTYGYFSSSRPYGYGMMDIYRVQLDCKPIPNTEVRGLVMGTDHKVPVEATITVKEKESGKVYGPFYSDKYTGKYLMVLPPMKSYELELTCAQFPASRPHREEFTIPKQCEYYQLFQEVTISRYVDSNAVVKDKQKAEFKNAFFDVKSKSREKYDLDVLKDNSSINNPPNVDLTFTPVIISGNLKHNEIQKAKKIEIFLIDKNKQIIKTTTTDNKGDFSFNGLDPEMQYTLLIKEDDLKISYYGDSKNNANKDIVVQGHLERLTGIENPVLPIENMDIVLIDNNKKPINNTVTDIQGNFNLNNTTINLNPIYADLNFPYKINANDLDMIYSAYITAVDSGDNYSEYVDIIDLPNQPSLLAKFENIYFDFDKYFLRNKSKEILEKISAYLIDHPDANIEIAGHCDWMGSDEYNIVLSENRTISAFNYLLNKGVGTNRMKKLWYGESRPAAQNSKPDGSDDPEGRQLNRRDEFKINVPGMALFTIRP
jgi:outer membrane protein OmpA-like peptidoglycan-associated protein/tetratricopeptide (TPR) repeat protein